MNNNDHFFHIQDEKPLITPKNLITILPLEDQLIKAINQARQIISNIIQGKDPRLLLIVGPCSLHDEQSALEYAGKLSQVATQYADTLFIIMRAYFAKPRTTKGWKGIIYDPLLDGSHDLSQGLALTRSLLIKINYLLPVGCEFLDLITPYYLSDLISWCAIGARTSASQPHREFASSLPMPVGFKNSIDGNIQTAIDAAQSSSVPHYYFGLNHEGQPASIQSQGNIASHIILRGSPLSPNYTVEQISHTIQILAKTGLAPRLIVDCSHDNCGKRYQQQINVIHEISQRIQNHHGQLTSFPICGIMLESNLIGGSQTISYPQALTYGQSITDPCLSWQETQPLLAKLAQIIDNNHLNTSPTEKSEN